MNKNELFKMYNDASENPEKYSNSFRNNLFNIIVLNNWLDEYNKKYMQKYKEEFGL